ncbi:MAG: DedA family protein [Deltaproteobacteria bacterium]|nr:DedA family protein [Deltaproteobacteria bacterium]
MSDSSQSIVWYRMPFFYMKRLYDWVLHWAETPYGTPALFVIAFVESSFFPIPPDVLLIALCLGLRNKSFWYAFVCTTGSILGAFLGYYIGFALWEQLNLKSFFFKYIFSEEVFNIVVAKYQENATLAVFTAAFTPIPYKVFTIAGGVCKISLLSLLLGSIAGRAGRFFLVALLIYVFGPPIKKFIDKYFDILAVVFTALLIGGFIFIKKVM